MARSFRSALLDSWIPGAEATRYGRTWRISGSRPIPQRRLAGRLGFVREGDVPTLSWDDEAKDFSRGAAASGVVVPFVVDPGQRRVAFQLESGEVRSSSFTGAFESVLNENPAHRWTVTPLVQHVPYERWLDSVDVVTEFRVRLERPNPHYSDNHQVERLLEDLRLQVAVVSGQGENVNTTDVQFQQFMDHVRQEYGKAVLKGRERSGEESEWRSAQGGTVPAQRRVESSNEDELSHEELLASLESLGDVMEVEDESARESEAP